MWKSVLLDADCKYVCSMSRNGSRVTCLRSISWLRDRTANNNSPDNLTPIPRLWRKYLALADTATSLHDTGQWQCSAQMFTSCHKLNQNLICDADSDNDRFPCEIRSRALKTNLGFLICIDSLRTKNFYHSGLDDNCSCQKNTLELRYLLSGVFSALLWYCMGGYRNL